MVTNSCRLWRAIPDGKIICTFKVIVEVRGCCISSIGFHSFLHIIKGNNMKTNHIMGCFHKQVVNVDYECPSH